MKKITLLALMLCISSFAFAQFPGPYCGPLDYGTNVEPISLVSIAEINNVTDAAVNGSPSHEDFTALTANLTLGEAYDITFEGNTGGNYDNSYTVFIDFNQNDILDDAGEVFGFEDVITNSNGTDGQSYTGSIAIPADALEGDTRMRVKKVYASDSYLDPCVEGGFGYGQAEDYTVNLAGVVQFPGPYCGPLDYGTNVEPISLVSIAEINNVTDAAVNGSPSHEDFTALTANLTLGEAYDITFEGNTGGNYDNSYTVFIDFNQNDILDDAGEVFGFEDVITNSNGTDGQSYTGSIAIPADALEGDTRMRVKKVYASDSYLDPCVEGGFGYGQAEDYTVNLAGVVLDPNVLPITLENQLPAFGDFNGSFTQAIANPDATGANTSATVAENTVPANAAFAGVNFGLETNIDISAQKGFTMTVWSPVANTPVLLKLENATTGVNAERGATTTTTGAWETVSFDFSTEGDLTFESVTIFMNFNVLDPATQTYYWDNLEQVDVLITGDARISEIDADQTGTDTQEFLEIQTEFANQSLNGMIAVLYNGNGAVSYTTVDLNGFTSDDNGYFLIGTDAVAGADITLGADNKIQNGADGVALYMADALNFPDGTAATDAGLVDAVVYGTNDSDATDLLAALGETIQWNESENGANGTESLQWDDATQGFCAGVPTPKAANTPCPVTSDGLSCATAFIATEGTIVGTQIDPSGDSAWFVYTPSANGSIIVSSCLGGADTVLNIWNECDDAEPAATNDDSCAFAPDGTGNQYASEIDGFIVAGGEDYFIQWDDQWSTDPFDWSISFIPAPLVELPITLEGGQTPVFGDFNGSSTQIIANPDASGENTSATVAQNTVPANAGFAGVNFALDTNIDISVNKGFTMNVWSPVANMPVLLKLENASGANAEITATTTTTSSWETITFDFSEVGQLTYEAVTIFMNFAVTDPADQTYYWDNLEQVDLNAAPDNDFCDGAIALECGSTVTGDTTNATNTDAPLETCGTGLATGPGVWYTLTFPAGNDYNVSVDTFESGFDTKLGVFSGACDALVCVGGNDDTGGLQSQVEFVALAGETYSVYVTGFAASAGAYNLTTSCEEIVPPAPDNDFCDGAIALECGTTVTGDTTNATNTDAPLETCGTGLATGPGVWYTLTFPAGNDYNVSVDTFESGFDTKLGVFSGACDALVCVGGNDDTGGLQSQVEFVALAGETYSVYVTGFATSAGLFNLNTTCEEIVPPVVELPITFEDGQLPILNDFNGSATQVIANPDASGANDSATVAENVVPANAGFAGVNFAVENLDISTLKGFTMTVWSQVPDMPVLLKLENATTGVNVERAATTTTTGAWETISFDFSEEGDLTFESVTVFMNFNVIGDTDQTYYWDNLVQGEPLDVTQNDLVDIAMYPNPATSVVTLEASQEIATIQIMNLLGQTVSIIEVNNTSSTVNVSQLRTGVYIANVLFSNGSIQTMKFIKE